MHVALNGMSYSAVDPTGDGRPSPGSGPGLATVRIERKSSTIGGDLGWEPILQDGRPLTILMTVSFLPDGHILWQADLKLPNPTDTFRLVVEEFERYPSDPANIGTVGIGIASRLVHADVIPL